MPSKNPVFSRVSEWSRNSRLPIFRRLLIFRASLDIGQSFEAVTYFWSSLRSEGWQALKSGHRNRTWIPCRSIRIDSKQCQFSVLFTSYQIPLDWDQIRGQMVTGYALQNHAWPSVPDAFLYIYIMMQLYNSFDIRFNSFLKSSTFFRQIETFKRRAKTTFRQIETIERQ